MCFLLDVNVLIALIDAGHELHLRAHYWFTSVGMNGWATSPITENAVLRILGNSRYPNSPGTPAGVLTNLASLRAQPGHEFWPDSVSFFDTAYFDQSRLLYPSQLTDSYLLALAVARRGKFATMDRRLATSAVIGGAQALYLIP